MTRVQKKKSAQGAWLLLLIIRWFFLNHSVSSARSNGGPGKAGLSTTYRPRSSGISSKAPRDTITTARKKLSEPEHCNNTNRKTRSARKTHESRAEADDDSDENDETFEQGQPEFESGEDDEREIFDYDDGDDNEDYDSPRRNNVASRDTRKGWDDNPGKRSGRRERSTQASKSSSRSSSKRVVPYARPSQPNPAALAFTRGIAAIRESIPDASALRETAMSTLNAAKETTGVITANIYREVKGLTSSELEQVMLKATRPDDSPVKGKHVERLVGVTYQISARYDIYDAVLRKLWSKMCEKDWRTTIKALYVLHRFSADGAPDHQPALKARLRELRRTKDPKRKEKYFNSKLILAGDSSPSTVAFRAFLSRYAHYVLLRAQCFGGTFTEMSIVEEGSSASALKQESSPKRKGKKAASSSSSATQSVSASKNSIISTALRSEHLDAAQMLLKAAIACALKEDEECENTAICVERVVADLIALTAAVAKDLNAALDKNDLTSLDRVLLKRWCEFYSTELLPQTKTMMKRMSPILDTYGLFLPSRIGVSVNPELLDKGLSFVSKANEESPSIIASGAQHNIDSVPTSNAPEKTLDDDDDDDDKRRSKDDMLENDDEKEEYNGDENEIIEKNESVADEEGDYAMSRTPNGSNILRNSNDSVDDEYEYYDEDECYEEENE